MVAINATAVRKARLRHSARYRVHWMDEGDLPQRRLQCPDRRQRVGPVGETDAQDARLLSEDGERLARAETVDERAADSELGRIGGNDRALVVADQNALAARQSAIGQGLDAAP